MSLQAGVTAAPQNHNPGATSGAPQSNDEAPTPASPPALPSPSGGVRPPTPTTTLIAQLQGIDPEAVEQAIVGVREAWKRGDQSVVADALISQATLLETLAAKFLRIAGSQESLKIIELYTGLALRALEGARKTLALLGGLREKPRVTTAVQVNVGGAAVPGSATNEILPGGADGE